MASRKAKIPRKRYTWALHAAKRRRPFDIRDLWQYGDPIEKGLSCAYALASNRRDRQRAWVNRREVPPLLEAEDIASEYRFSPVSVRTWIARAREHYVGTISDRAYNASRRRTKDRLKRPIRPCAEPDCRNVLPGPMHANRRYCDDHRTGKVRVARYRRSRT